jgi:thymidylate synthase
MNIEVDYKGLILDILNNGIEREDRTGTGTISIFGRQIRHCMCKGFPLLTTKKMPIKSIMTELKWFLKGDTNIKYLVDNGCNIWNGDAYKNYEKYALANSYGVDILSMDEFIEQIKTDAEFAEKWGELGPIYGKQWRSWTEYYTEKFNGGNPIIVERTADQIQNLINGLKSNPNSRRHMVNAWNVGELDGMTLPPCHYGFQCYVADGKLSLMWNQRSVDTFLGLPFNIASYGALLLILCEETGYEPGDLIGNLGDVHLYKNHIEQSITLVERDTLPLPKLNITNSDILNGEFDYELIDYNPHPTIKAPLSN